MKKNYLLLLRHLWKAPATLVLLVLLAMPSLSWGQTFTETFGTSGPKSVVDADFDGDFDNSDIGFFYGDNTSLVTPGTGTIPASPNGGSFIYFGDANGATIARNAEPDDRIFSIYQINTENILNPVLTFSMYIENRNLYSGGDILVDYSLDGSEYIGIKPINNQPPVNGWRTVSIPNPFDGNAIEGMILRFRRVRNARTRLAIDNVVLSGTTPPNFTVAPDTRTFPNTGVNSTSTAQTLSVNGSGLTSSIVAIAPTGFLIRQQGIGAYGNTVNLVPTDGSVNATIQVVFSPQTAGSFDDQITFNTTGVNQQTVRVIGTAVLPNITVSPTTLALPATAVGGTSAPRSITVTGSNLSGNISVAAPTGFLVRQQNVGTYGATLVLTPSNGSVNTVVEVVFNPQTAGQFDDQIIFNSASATPRTVRVTSTALSPTIAVDPTSLALPATAVGGTSAPRSISVTGSNLSGDINLVAPDGFLVRQQGIGTYGTTLALAPVGGSVNTLVEVVFTPQTAGPANGQITFNSAGATQITVAVSSTALSPTITVTPTSLAFGNVEVNARSGVQSIAVEGSNLSADISVQVPSGYEFRKAGDANFLASGNTLTLAQTNGSVNTSVEVRFAPITTGTFNGNATLISAGATTQFVGFTGTGINPAPVVTVSTTNPATPNSSTINFPDTRIGRNSNPISFFVSGQNLDNNTVIVSSPSQEFQIRLGNSGVFVAQVTLTSTNGNLAARELQVQFSPSAVGTRSAIIAASSGTTVNQILQVNGNGLAASTTPEIFITPDPTTLNFGSVASNGSSQVLTFRVGGTMLGSNSLVLTPASFGSSNQNIEMRVANIGDFRTGPLSIAPINGSVSEQTIEVRLRGPLTLGQYRGTITASSPNSNAPNKVVDVEANSTGASATVSADNTLQLFSTVPGVASATQSFQVNGSGLIRDITVRAPAFFQVALQIADFAALNGATGNSITVVRNNVAGDGYTNPVPVYVRYLPSVANLQPDLASINVTSSPAIGAAVQVEGYSAPAVEIQTPIPVFANVQGTSAPIAVTVRASRVRQAITVAEVLTDATQFNNPLQDQFQISLTQNDADFGKTVTFTPNQSTYSIDQVVYIRYKPTHLGNATSKLQFSSQDFTNPGFQDFASNGSIRGNALDNQPVAQSTISVIRNGSTAVVNFTPGINGAGEGRLIIASLNNALDGNSQPQDGQTYLSADGTIGQGRSVAPGYFSVYTGPAAQAEVKGLDPTKAYYFYVFDYNYVTTNTSGEELTVPGAENYLTPTPATQLVPVAAVTPGTPPLPVELVSFSAKLNKGRVNLAWETASEKNNKGFEVQRSQDGITFSTILFKSGQGNSNGKTAYTMTDEQPLAGISYYRLKQIDYDGTTSLSPVVSITNLTGAAAIEMYPNPVQGQGPLYIRGAQPSKAGAQVTITDLTGRVVRTEQLATTGELNMSTLPAGTYLITVNDGTQKVTRRIVKN